MKGILLCFLALSATLKVEGIFLFNWINKGIFKNRGDVSDALWKEKSA